MTHGKHTEAICGIALEASNKYDMVYDLCIAILGMFYQEIKASGPCPGDGIKIILQLLMATRRSYAIGHALCSISKVVC